MSWQDNGCAGCNTHCPCTASSGRPGWMHMHAQTDADGGAHVVQAYEQTAVGFQAHLLSKREGHVAILDHVLQSGEKGQRRGDKARSSGDACALIVAGCGACTEGCWDVPT